jgi:hypothetical protein
MLLRTADFQSVKHNTSALHYSYVREPPPDALCCEREPLSGGEQPSRLSQRTTPSG